MSCCVLILPRKKHHPRRKKLKVSADKPAGRWMVLSSIYSYMLNSGIKVSSYLMKKFKYFHWARAIYMRVCRMQCWTCGSYFLLQLDRNFWKKFFLLKNVDSSKINSFRSASYNAVGVLYLLEMVSCIMTRGEAYPETNSASVI